MSICFHLEIIVELSDCFSLFLVSCYLHSLLIIVYVKFIIRNIAMHSRASGSVVSNVTCCLWISLSTRVDFISVHSTKSSAKQFASSTVPTSPNLFHHFPSSFSWRSVHLFQILSRPLLSEDQGYYSFFSEACQDHQKLDSFTPFPSFTAYSRNFIPQIIIHPQNMQFMERLASFLLS